MVKEILCSPIVFLFFFFLPEKISIGFLHQGRMLHVCLSPLDQHRFVDFLEGPTLKWGPPLKEHLTKFVGPNIIINLK